MNSTDDSTTSSDWQPLGLPPQPPRRRHTLRNILIIAAGAFLAIIAAVIVLAAALSSGSPHVKVASTATPTAAVSAPAAAAPETPASTPDNLTGPLGTTFTVTSTDSSGNDVSYNVTATRVLDPARGADQYTTPDIGKRFVGVQFTIAGGSGYSHDNANSDAVILGSDGQTYTPTFDSISAGTNFNAGDFSVTAGQSQIGWVTFQLPRGVSVTSVQWQPGLGDQQPATWTVGG